MTFTRILVLERKFAHARRVQAVFLGGTDLEMFSSVTEPVTLFWSSIFAWGAEFLLGGGAQAVILGDTDPKCLPWRRAYTLHLCKPHSDAIIQKSVAKKITL